MKAKDMNLQKDKAAKKPAGKVGKSEEIHTDLPLSEKDEIKQAEERLRKNTRKRL